MRYLPNCHSLPRASSIQHICCCPAAERYRQNPWNAIPAYFLFEILFSHPEETVASRDGNDLNIPCIFHTVCLVFFLIQLFSGDHIFQNVTKSSLGLLRFKDGPRPLNVLPEQTQQDSHLLLIWLPTPYVPWKLKIKIPYLWIPFFEWGRFGNACVKDILTVSIRDSRIPWTQ